MKIIDNFDEFYKAVEEAATETLNRTSENIKTHAKSIAAVKKGYLQKGIDKEIKSVGEDKEALIFTDTSNSGKSYGYAADKQMPNLLKKPNPGLNPDAQQFFMEKSLEKEVGDGSLLIDTFEDELNKRW